MISHQTSKSMYTIIMMKHKKDTCGFNTCIWRRISS